MAPEPKLSQEVPARWIGCVVLNPTDVEGRLRLLPEGPLPLKLQAVLKAPRARAEGLNRLDHNGAPFLSHRDRLTPPEGSPELAA
jgi:hypothetical protein